jgi:hypothetical protein
MQMAMMETLIDAESQQCPNTYMHTSIQLYIHVIKQSITVTHFETSSSSAAELFLPLAILRDILLRHRWLRVFNSFIKIFQRYLKIETT